MLLLIRDELRELVLASSGCLLGLDNSGTDINRFLVSRMLRLIRDKLRELVLASSGFLLELDMQLLFSQVFA